MEFYGVEFSTKSVVVGAVLILFVLLTGLNSARTRKVNRLGRKIKRRRR